MTGEREELPAAFEVEDPDEVVSARGCQQPIVGAEGHVVDAPAAGVEDQGLWGGGDIAELRDRPGRS